MFFKSCNVCKKPECNLCYTGPMYWVCGLRLALNFGVRQAADNNLHLRLTVEKMGAYAVLPINIYVHKAVVVPILRLQLTVQIKN